MRCWSSHFQKLLCLYLRACGSPVWGLSLQLTLSLCHPPSTGFRIASPLQLLNPRPVDRDCFSAFSLAVGQFQALVREADLNSQLHKTLQCILKLSKEKWEEAAQHALTAVVPDFRRRVWYPPGEDIGGGIVFNCKYGAVQLKEGICTAHTGADGAVQVRVRQKHEMWEDCLTWCCNSIKSVYLVIILWFDSCAIVCAGVS